MPTPTTPARDADQARERPASTWPPPPTVDRPWTSRRRLVGYDLRGWPVHLEEVVREVRLWGRLVLIDEDESAVWCPSCRDWIPLEELLATPHTGHPIDSRPRRGVWQEREPTTSGPPRRLI